MYFEFELKSTKFHVKKRFSSNAVLLKFKKCFLLSENSSLLKQKLNLALTGFKNINHSESAYLCQHHCQ